MHGSVLFFLSTKEFQRKITVFKRGKCENDLVGQVKCLRSKKWNQFFHSHNIME